MFQQIFQAAATLTIIQTFAALMMVFFVTNLREDGT